MRLHDHIREDDIRNNALISVLDANATVAFFDDTIIENHLPDRIHIFGANLYSATTAGHGTIVTRDVFAGAKLAELTPVLQADTVITTFNVTITDAYILAVVEINAIAVSHF